MDIAYLNSLVAMTIANPISRYPGSTHPDSVLSIHIPQLVNSTQARRVLANELDVQTIHDFLFENMDELFSFKPTELHIVLKWFTGRYPSQSTTLRTLYKQTLVDYLALKRNVLIIDTPQYLRTTLLELITRSFQLANRLLPHEVSAEPEAVRSFYQSFYEDNLLCLVGYALRRDRVELLRFLLCHRYSEKQARDIASDILLNSEHIFHSQRFAELSVEELTGLFEHPRFRTMRPVVVSHGLSRKILPRQINSLPLGMIFSQIARYADDPFRYWEPESVQRAKQLLTKLLALPQQPLLETTTVLIQKVTFSFGRGLNSWQYYQLNLMEYLLLVCHTICKSTNSKSGAGFLGHEHNSAYAAIIAMIRIVVPYQLDLSFREKTHDKYQTTARYTAATVLAPSAYQNVFSSLSLVDWLSLIIAVNDKATIGANLGQLSLSEHSVACRHLSDPHSIKTLACASLEYRILSVASILLEKDTTREISPSKGPYHGVSYLALYSKHVAPRSVFCPPSKSSVGFSDAHRRIKMMLGLEEGSLSRGIDETRERSRLLEYVPKHGYGTDHPIPNESSNNMDDTAEGLNTPLLGHKFKLRP